jgi:hypothetical protein
MEVSRVESQSNQKLDQLKKADSAQEAQELQSVLVVQEADELDSHGSDFAEIKNMVRNAAEEPGRADKLKALKGLIAQDKWLPNSLDIADVMLENPELKDWLS